MSNDAQTQAVTSTQITAYQLGELLKKARPHIGDELAPAAVQGMRLDCDGVHLHAVATDRYTLAVARVGIRPTPAWALTLTQDALIALTAWTTDIDDSATLTLTPGKDTLNVSAGGGRQLTVGTRDETWPDWRTLIRRHLDTLPETALTPEPAPSSGWSSEFLARWTAAGYALTVWHNAAAGPLVILGHDLIGLQMPMNSKHTTTPEAVWTGWQNSLTPAGSATTSDPDDFLAEAAGGTARDQLADAMTEDLLKQTMRSATDLFSAATSDPGALAAYALAGGRSWIAYRLLEALRMAAPKLLRKTLTEVNAELEDGDFCEWAWEAARQAGHDPEAWNEEYEQHLARVTTKAAVS
ncbi:hypothetical protein ACGFYY_32680 [Streptomyces sp. NPDC048331]|uniref:hypothetical protein n=1 Tax=Streptomyces sp. NPDC048331 TaxID=3365534 RepID=UPI00371B8964